MHHGGKVLTVLVCHGLLNYISNIADSHLPRNGTNHSFLGSPISISDYENSLKTWSLANLMEEIL